MTAILPEQPTVLALIDAPRLIVPGIASWVGKSDYQQLIDDGHTESFEDFCDRISKTEGP